MRAKYLMRKMSSVNEDTCGRDIIYKLMGTEFPGLPVVNKNRKIVGVVTEFDLIRAIQAGKGPDEPSAGEIMSKEISTAWLDKPQDEIINMMLENNFTIVPIVSDNKLDGIVSRLEIIDAYVDPDLYNMD